MSRQRVLGATLVWLVVVASVSALVWVVISRAGDDLVSSDQTLMTTGGDTSSAPGTPSARPTRSPSRTPSRAPSASPSQTPTNGTSPTPTTPSPSSSSPSPSSSPAPAPSPSSPPPSPTATPSSPTEQPSVQAAEERRTWQGRSGSVVAACGGNGIRLVSAQPANGFSADVKDEDGALKVEFEGREDESGTDLSVVARCVGGVPSFSVGSRDD